MSDNALKRPFLLQALRSGLAYGLGLVAGSALDLLITTNASFLQATSELEGFFEYYWDQAGQE